MMVLLVQLDRLVLRARLVRLARLALRARMAWMDPPAPLGLLAQLGLPVLRVRLVPRALSQAPPARQARLGRPARQVRLD